MKPSFLRTRRLYRFFLAGKAQPYGFEETIPTW